MKDLERLTDEGKILVQTDPDFLTVDGGTIDTLEDHVEDDVDGRFDRERLDAEVERVMETYDNDPDEERNAMDAELAPVVHEAIDVTRREATKPGIWWYLTVCHYPEYVRYRWKDGNLSEKFLGIRDTPADEETARVDPELSSTGIIKDPYSMALNRLWWAGELTYDAESDDYLSTQRMFFPQRLANWVLDSKFRRYPTAARAFADVFCTVDTDTINESADRFKRSLSLYQLEVRSYDDLCSQLATIKDAVETG